MKARSKFIRMFSKLPDKAKRELVFDAYGNNPMSLNVIYMEVKYNTPLGVKLLKQLGYEDA